MEFFSKIFKTTKGPPLTSKGPPPPHYPITKFPCFFLKLGVYNIKHNLSANSLPVFSLEILSPSSPTLGHNRKLDFARSCFILEIRINLYHTLHFQVCRLWSVTNKQPFTHIFKRSLSLGKPWWARSGGPYVGHGGAEEAGTG